MESVTWVCWNEESKAAWISMAGMERRSARPAELATTDLLLRHWFWELWRSAHVYDRQLIHLVEWL